jgi:GntR family transcriptional regulator
VARDPVGIPIYRQLSLQLQKRIDAREWAPGEQLPTEPVLAVEFGVNRLTVRQAIDELVRAGAVVVRHGKGTFVAREVLRNEIEVDPQTQKSDYGSVIQATMHAVGGPLIERVAGFEDDHDPSAAGYLHTSPESLARLVTVAWVESEPVLFNEYWVDGARFPNLPDHWETGMTMIEVLREAFGVTLFYDWRGFSATAAGLMQAELLRVPVGHPLLLRDGVSVDEAGRPVYYVRRHIPGERAKFVLRYRPGTFEA